MIVSYKIVNLEKKALLIVFEGPSFSIPINPVAGIMLNPQEGR